LLKTPSTRALSHSGGSATRVFRQGLVERTLVREQMTQETYQRLEAVYDRVFQRHGPTQLVDEVLRRVPRWSWSRGPIARGPLVMRATSSARNCSSSALFAWTVRAKSSSTSDEPPFARIDPSHASSSAILAARFAGRRAARISSWRRVSSRWRSIRTTSAFKTRASVPGLLTIVNLHDSRTCVRVSPKTLRRVRERQKCAHRWCSFVGLVVL
jgi:hypothetical protein